MFCFSFDIFKYAFSVVLVSEFLRMLLWKSLRTLERNDTIWIFSDWSPLIDNCSEFLINIVLKQSVIMSTLPQTYGIRFTYNLANSAFDDLLRTVFINAILSTIIAYSWRGCSPSLVCSSRSCSNISFKLALCCLLTSSIEFANT